MVSSIAMILVAVDGSSRKHASHSWIVAAQYWGISRMRLAVFNACESHSCAPLKSFFAYVLFVNPCYNFFFAVLTM